MNPEVAVSWDAIVIGAGPAGSVCAILLARRGYKVLLVERSAFPRDKVCGCCLSGRAVKLLNELGLSKVLNKSVMLNSFVMGVNGRQVKLGANGGRAISRSLFDAELVREAVSCGVCFMPSTTARCLDLAAGYRGVGLSQHGRVSEVQAKAIFVCSGLGNATLSKSIILEEEVAEDSRIGLTTLITATPAYEAGTIFMAVNKDGYLGITCLEDGRLNISAAVNKQSLRLAGSPGEMAKTILSDAGFNIPLGLDQADWMGTRELTRHLVVPAAERIFCLGDAASYVEPFTGQGMTWAMETAQLIQPIASRAINSWSSDLMQEWTSYYAGFKKNKQRTCQWVSYFTHRPGLVSKAVRVLCYMPFLANPVIRSIHGRNVLKKSEI